jgi:hypothetical protein
LKGETKRMNPWEEECDEGREEEEEGKEREGE